MKIGDHPRDIFRSFYTWLAHAIFIQTPLCERKKALLSFL